MKPTKVFQVIALSLAMIAMLGSGFAEARPWGPPGHRPGWGPPGPRPWGPRPWGPPPPRYHHHDWVGGVVGGALALGLGLGIANVITNAATPRTQYVPTPVPPPNYPAYTYSAPTVTYAPSQPSVVTTVPDPLPSKGVMYWCQASKNFYPYVTTCESGWQVTKAP